MTLLIRRSHEEESPIRTNIGCRKNTASTMARDKFVLKKISVAKTRVSVAKTGVFVAETPVFDGHNPQRREEKRRREKRRECVQHRLVWQERHIGDDTEL